MRPSSPIGSVIGLLLVVSPVAGLPVPEVFPQSDGGVPGDAPDSFEAARPVEAGSIHGHLNGAWARAGSVGDIEDWYRVSLRAGERLDVVLGTVSPSPGNSVLRVWTPQGVQAGAASPGPLDADFFIATEDGDWRLQVAIANAYVLSTLPAGWAPLKAYTINLTIQPQSGVAGGIAGARLVALGFRFERTPEVPSWAQCTWVEGGETTLVGTSSGTVPRAIYGAQLSEFGNHSRRGGINAEEATPAQPRVRAAGVDQGASLEHPARDDLVRGHLGWDVGGFEFCESWGRFYHLILTSGTWSYTKYRYELGPGAAFLGAASVPLASGFYLQRSDFEADTIVSTPSAAFHTDAVATLESEHTLIAIDACSPEATGCDLEAPPGGNLRRISDGPPPQIVGNAHTLVVGFDAGTWKLSRSSAITFGGDGFEFIGGDVVLPGWS